APTARGPHRPPGHHVRTIAGHPRAPARRRVAMSSSKADSTAHPMCARIRAMTTESARNMRLLAHDPLNGFGNCGEGMGIQLTGNGRRVLWLAHESAPKNVTAVDVTEPRHPV